MGWFQEQISQRKSHDNNIMDQALRDIAAAVTGEYSERSEKIKNGKELSEALQEVFRYYHIRVDLERLASDKQTLEQIIQPSGMMCRHVDLEEDWYKTSFGAMIGTRKSDGCTVALIPSGISGYQCFLPGGGSFRMTKENADSIDGEAIAFYRPFPSKSLTGKDIWAYIVRTINRGDLLLLGLACAICALAGLLTPLVTQLAFSTVLPSGDRSLLLALACMGISAAVGATLLGSLRSIMLCRLDTRISVSLEAAVMIRITELPPDFFREYSSGDLAMRVRRVGVFTSALIRTSILSLLSAVFALLYFWQIARYAPELLGVSLITVGALILLIGLSMYVGTQKAKKEMELSGKNRGMSYSIMTGIQKIKLAGAEKRAFSRWAEGYAREAAVTYRPNLLYVLADTLAGGILIIGTLFLYRQAIIKGISVADYYAFNSAFTLMTNAFILLLTDALYAADLLPCISMVRPILAVEPEIQQNKERVDRLSGAIEINNLSFRYNDTMPMVLDDFSLKIRPGEYIAICGTTGCGKSTLMRLMLGFEKPITGAIYYDSHDIQKVDLKSLRQKIGVVMQNGGLFQDDIYSNIVISAPTLSVDDAWEAAEMAGIADDIRDMPMGMYTLLSEGGGGLSGGQKQRLMIARALAPKPKILMLDEATSALDNITQKKVSESLDALHCTRIVIAHRLSTIQQCDRIIVLDKGKIVEDGKYEELIRKKGIFADLVERQRIQ